MAFLNKDEILAASDIMFRDVEVPEWTVIGRGETAMVRVAGLTAAEATKFSSRLVQMDGKGSIKEVKIDNFLAELLVRTLVNENFEPLFNDADIEALGKKSAAVMKRLGDIAIELSGLNEKAVEEKVKN
jgi:hypothetical protein